MIETAVQIAERARPIFLKYHFKKVGVFGSHARGDATESSDIDFIYKPSPELSYHHIDDAQRELEALFGVEVDLVPSNAVVARMRPYIKKDIKIIFEQ